MLTELRVKNYALIKDLVFKPGHTFNVITGETGAGKSILLGALGLILGERADMISIKDNEDKCSIEGYFNIANYHLKTWFIHNEFDYDDLLIIRREILMNGKSRSFINDTPAQLSQLKELGGYLIDIHSQHDNLNLFQKSFQFKVLDSFAGIADDNSKYLKLFNQLKTNSKKLSDLLKLQSDGENEKSYKQFLYDELLSANLKEGELVDLEKELSALSHAEKNIQLLSAIQNQLSESDHSISDQLALVKNQLLQVSKNDSGFETVAAKFSEANLVFKDLIAEIEQLAHTINLNPERLDFVNQRVNLLNNLSRKHQDEDLIKKLNTIEIELNTFNNLEDEINKANDLNTLIELECKKLSEDISSKRMSHSKVLEKRINDLILKLGMPGARIKVELITGLQELGIYGSNDANFLYSPAPEKLFNPIQNIASGGEISRVMLVLKSILAQKNTMPTIIFDEIDSGISGEIAFKMAELLEEMSNHLQLIAITHLPQIAAKGSDHFFVYKNVNNQITSSEIKKLTEDERVHEISEMIGGKDYSASIHKSAQQLLSNK